MKILIVDDNKRIREMMKNILVQPEVEFYECSNGIQALECYRKVKPDWVLMDIVMTGMDGFTATQAILAEHPDARIVVVTNYEDKQYRDLAKQLGAKDYVLKEDLVRLREICRE